MKKIIYIWIMIVSMTVTGCYDLDTYPGDKLNEGLFWKTEEHVHQGLMGVYAQMRANEAFGFTFMWDCFSDVAYGYDNPGYQPILRGTYTARTSQVVDKWSNLYEGVQRANLFISKIIKADFLDEPTKAEYIAEGKFLRALYYFTLLNFYGGVPYYDETTNVNADYADMKNPRSTADEIRSHIVADLNEAIAKLRVSWPDSEYGRATKGAAYALRGKVYLYNKEWGKAISDFEEIVYNKSNNYGYELHPDFAELFKLYNGKKSKEMIFAIQNKGGAGFPYGMRMCFYLGTRSSYSGWNNSVPSNSLVDMFERNDGKPFNWDDIYPGYNSATVDQRKDLLCIKLATDGKKIESLLNADTVKILNVYKNRDPRLMATAIVPYSKILGWSANAPKEMLFVLHATGGGSPMAANGFVQNNNGGWVTYAWRKFVPEANLNGALTDKAQTPFEFPLIRYADVLLMLAEAYNESNQLDKAVAELNKVRARASVRMPGLNSGSTWMAVTSKAEMAKRIQHERAVELAVEGHRFNDLRRWGIAKSTLQKRPSVNIYGGSQYTQLFEDRDMLWPVPAVEIERNPLIEQNPGWE